MAVGTQLPALYPIGERAPYHAANIVRGMYTKKNNKGKEIEQIM